MPLLSSLFFACSVPAPISPNLKGKAGSDFVIVKDHEALSWARNFGVVILPSSKIFVFTFRDKL